MNKSRMGENMKRIKVLNSIFCFAAVLMVLSIIPSGAFAAENNPKSLTHADVMQLQCTIGNWVIGRLLLLSSIGIIFSIAQKTPFQRQEIQEDEEPLQSKMKGPILVPLKSGSY